MTPTALKNIIEIELKKIEDKHILENRTFTKSIKNRFRTLLEVKLLKENNIDYTQYINNN